MTTLATRTTPRAAAVAMVVTGAFCQPSGAAVAGLLFPRAGALGMVMLRLAFSAILLAITCRPRWRGHTRADWLVIAGFGLALATMNTLFYLAVARIPLGAAVTFEVLGPLVLAVATTRRWLWATLALAGVATLSRAGLTTGLDLPGVAFALGAGAMWAAYIVLSQRTAGRFPKTDGLALALVVAAVATLPLGLSTAGQALADPVVLGLGLVVAVLSSALPYSLELRALRTLPAGTFAVLTCLTPAIATVVGFAVLGQALTLVEAAATALVVTASIGAVRARPPSREG
ncbi:EamA family transporter [Actinokineospora spheciospongiae]|uniref:EamA family transporter n=1 Tax=Actinokineospora spheciospongiae TaxID=909613 RepID=UPI001F37B1FC|nr:EamA family transporter [Actinokineospora spheciospongiae]